METIWTDGAVIPPMLILTGKQILQGWIAESLANKVFFATSESGFPNHELGLAYIKHFDKQTEKQTQGEWRLLLLDGHGAHHNQEIIVFANSKKIAMVSSSPHATHFYNRRLVLLVFAPKSSKELELKFDSVVVVSRIFHMDRDF